MSDISKSLMRRLGMTCDEFLLALNSSDLRESILKHVAHRRLTEALYNGAGSVSPTHVSPDLRESFRSVYADRAERRIRLWLPASMERSSAFELVVPAHPHWDGWHDRPYDLLAICLFPATGRWEFAFISREAVAEGTVVTWPSPINGHEWSLHAT
jgi:hypothetical protein